ncbi:membrane fusion protein (multidrug efflux system) [Hydrogenispora ethanolica]|uniref:Membrane fusion protein (Multidrug efflux system) n=1 Tax=Hydrogenispora ethanolica TaxID=1082276 RepID=A0A4V2QF09_HYDET|nr:HlyD family secretion protein [Hydrogenispora ethanolica]TCL70117.1 membrane fusion protein (multidrug efflux system) [Hydrogenispora ethanolica]
MKIAFAKNLFIPVVLVLALAAGGGWYWYTSMSGYIETDDAIVDGYQATIGSKILGRIAGLLVKENQKVQAGQTLVQLDDSDLRAQENQAQAALAYAQQNVNLARVNQAKAQEDFARAAAQFKAGFISREQYDHAKSALDVTRAQIAIAQSQVASAQSQLNVVRTQLLNTRIAAPMGGVISKRWVMTGDVVQAGQSIFSIYDVQHVWVTANFEETKLARLRVGEPVAIAVDAYPGARFQGRVQEIGANTAAQFSLIPPNNASGNFTKITQRIPVKITFASLSAAQPLLPGMSVEVKVKVN